MDTSKEVGVKVNTEKDKYMLMFHHQNAEQNHVKLINVREMWQNSIFGNNTNKSKLN
jgi:hypothetical protein